MEKEGEIVPPGVKRLNLINLFRKSVRSLLTAFPFEDFSKAFPNFSEDQQDVLFRLYLQVITSLHENMQEEFDSICHNTQVGIILDTVEYLAEQQRLDPLSSQKTNIKQVKHDLLATKKNEILLLQDMLNKAEEDKHNLKARLKLHKMSHEETSVVTDALDKLRSMVDSPSSYIGSLQDV